MTQLQDYDLKIQNALFDLIQKKLEGSTPCHKEIARILKLESRCVRNRMTGKTYLSFPEFFILAQYFDITTSDIAQHPNLSDSAKNNTAAPPQRIDLQYLPLMDKELSELTGFMEQMLADIQQLAAGKEGWIKMACTEVPLVHLMAFEELTYFKIYMYYHHIVDSETTFEAFLRKIRPLKLDRYFKTIHQSYRAIHSEEVWDPYTFEKLLRLIEECDVYRKFEDSATLVLLLEQAEALAQQLEPIIMAGHKTGGTRLEVYHYESVIRGGFVLMGYGNQISKGLLRTFMMQSVAFENRQLLLFMKKAFRALLCRSNAMGKSSHRFKNEFLNLLSEQVESYRSRLCPLQE
ncbi:hypothetical protein [Sphingobacterium luzhongxinii]|uniref:hypothetical protein n=1 Tax=Sphingobacterium luzhongxinii TaxID=2654181 RepID=UPI0013DA2C38|nr:hypothetical protein [Sphingobacterium sp. xlx-73]